MKPEMLGAPQEARAHAVKCIELAGRSRSPTVQKIFNDLAAKWVSLANEQENATALLQAVNELETPHTHVYATNHVERSLTLPRLLELKSPRP